MEYDKEKLEIKKIEDYAKIKNKKVLEIGCGDGRVSSMIAQKTDKLTAIDPDRKKIRKAKFAIKNVDFRTGYGENLKFENTLFDVVIFTYSLHHQDSKKALAEARRVLKCGGRLVVIEPSWDGEAQQFFHLFKDEIKKIKKVQETLKKSKFKLKRKETFTVDAVFRDKNHLYKYFFDHYGRKKSTILIKKMNELLGKKENLHPIVLKDKIVIFYLQKA